MLKKISFDKKITKFFQKLNRSDVRTIKARKNIFLSLIIKGASIIIGFLIVPITLDYLNQMEYGVWITISSFLAWFTFFEIGLGNGLRNKLAEALAKEDYYLGKKFVSTTYAILFIIIGIIAIIFFFVNDYLNWAQVLNTEPHMAEELKYLALIVFSFFFFRFIIKLINIVLIADQRPAVSNLFGPLGNLFSLVIIYILTKTTEGSLIYIGVVYSAIPVIVLLCASFYFYSTDYSKIAPSVKFIDFRYARGLLSLGVKFFLIQMSTLLIFQSSNIIIAQFFGPSEVTYYSVTYKYFSIITMLFSILIMPFWSAFTEAWTKKEFKWVRMTIRNLLRIWIGFVFLSIFMIIMFDSFFNLWLGEEEYRKMSIPATLKYSLVIYFLLHTFGGIFNMFINGVGKIKLQMISLGLGAILFIPLVIFFEKVLNWGIESIVIAAIISNFYTPLVAPIQYYKIINNRAHGIWKK